MRTFLSPACFVGLLFFPCTAGAEEPVNLAPQGLLPAGAGLAAGWRSEGAWGKDPAVVFADDFEADSLGETWDERRDKDGKVLSRTDPGVAWLGKGCLRVESLLDRDTGGGLTKWFPPVDPVHVRFYTRFEETCDYIHHFVTLRANRSWKGGDKWSGFGGAGLKPAGDERFSTAIEPWGNYGKWDPPGRWNSYSYWPGMKASGDGKYWGNSFIEPSAPLIKRGRWICVEFMLRHNKPGEEDGEQAFWIDGRLAGHWKGIKWRVSETLMANALTLETYVTDRWTKQQRNVVLFDNVVIARCYIGPEAGDTVLSQGK
jgi:hypothetical protein